MRAFAWSEDVLGLGELGILTGDTTRDSCVGSRMIESQLPELSLGQYAWLEQVERYADARLGTAGGLK